MIVSIYSTQVLFRKKNTKKNANKFWAFDRKTAPAFPKAGGCFSFHIPKCAYSASSGFCSVSSPVSSSGCVVYVNPLMIFSIFAP